MQIANTPKVITTTGDNKGGEKIMTRKCSLPEEKPARIQQALKIKNKPFKKLKALVHDLSRFIGKPEVKKSLPVIYKAFTLI